MENKYSCNCYDSGYCYCLARPLTDEENEFCEDDCSCYLKERKENNNDAIT